MNKEQEIIEETSDEINDFSAFFDAKIPTLILYPKLGDQPEQLWHTVQNGKAVYMPEGQSQVTGEIESLTVRKIVYDATEQKKYKKEFSFKFRITLNQAGKRKVIIQSGLDTWFTKSVVSRLEELNNQNLLTSPSVSIGVYRSKEDVLFGYVKCNGQTIKTEQKEIPAQDEFIELIDVLNAAIKVKKEGFDSL